LAEISTAWSADGNRRLEKIRRDLAETRDFRGAIIRSERKFPVRFFKGVTAKNFSVECPVFVVRCSRA
jgi:hypothetical protein